MTRESKASPVRDCTQCEAINSSNKLRCKNRTCVSAKYCHVHLKKKEGLRVKNSTIPKSGKGLYTIKERKKNDLIGEYRGERKTTEEYRENNTGYGVQLNKDTIIDAVSTQSSNMRYINSCTNKDNQKKLCKGNNVKFVLHNGKIRVRAKKKIKANEEMFISYGRGYWNRR